MGIRNRHRGVVATTVVAGFLVVMGGIAIAAQSTSTKSQQAITQTSIVNAPSANDNPTGTNPPLAQSPLAPMTNSNNPLANNPLAMNPLSPTPSTIPSISGNRNVTTTTSLQTRSNTTTPSGGAATPTTSVTPTSTVNTIASNPRVTTTTVAPVVAPTTAVFDRTFTVDAANNSSEFLPGDPRIGLDISTSDNGGFITKVSVNWQAGDAPESKAYDLVSCVLNTLTGRPSTSHNEHFEHTYAASGTYNVVVAVTSTDCLGNSPRTTYQTVTVTASGASTSAMVTP